MKITPVIAVQVSNRFARSHSKTKALGDAYSSFKGAENVLKAAKRKEMARSQNEIKDGPRNKKRV